MSAINITIVTPRSAAADVQELQLSAARAREVLERLKVLLSSIQGNVTSTPGVQLAIGSGTAVTKASGTVALVQASLTAGDIVYVGNVGFVATNGAVTPGAATFDMRTSSTLAGASLAAQINAHASLAGLVSAASVTGTVTITAVLNSSLSNLICLGKKVTTAAGVILNGGADTVTVASLTGGAAGVDAAPVTYTF